MVAPVWTEAEDAIIRRMVAQDKSAKEIAIAVGRTYRAVQRRAILIGCKWSIQYRRRGLTTGGTHLGAQKHAARQEAVKKAANLRKEGLSPEDIATKLGTKVPTVWKYLREAGMGVRLHVQPSEKARGISASERAKIGGHKTAELFRARRADLAPKVRNMVAAGKTRAEVRKALSIGEGALRAICIEHDILFTEKGARNSRLSPGYIPTAAQRRVRANFYQRAGRRVTEVQAQRSLYLDAATFLASHYRPVVRSDVVDKPYDAPKGEPREYIVGKVRMPAVEMLDMARGLGFPA